MLLYLQKMLKEDEPVSAKQPKKLLIFNILDILRKYTDENHRLSQKEIEEILKKEYEMTVDRKSVKANLMDLIEFGYEIEYSESLRMIKNKATGEMEESYILSDFYMARDITDSELRLLIDGLLFSTHLPYSQCKNLIEKLEKLSNVYFRSRIKHIATMPEDKTNNHQLFYNIDILDEAISHGKKVSFKYLEYDLDLNTVKKKQADGNERVYIVSPYQMVAKEGKYYLICNYDKYDDVSNYRIDRIADISILDENIKPFEKLKWSNGQKLNLTTYMKEHVYMYSSGSSKVKMKIVDVMLSDIVDMFGKDIKVAKKEDGYVEVTVQATDQAIVQFAKNYVPDVIVLEPNRIREQVIEELKKGLVGYE